MEQNPSKNEETLFPLETCPPVSDEAFNLFHSIDRELYTRLIHNLGRDPVESMQVMAFWMWIERQRNDSSLITKLLTLPPTLVNDLADEAVRCLKCIESDRFRADFNEILLLPELVGSRPGAAALSLRFFHENRVAALRGLSRIISTVCARAFHDILMRAVHGKSPAVAPPQAAAEGGGGAGGVRPPVRVISAVHEVGESSREAERRGGGSGSGGGGGGGAQAAPPPPPVMPVMYHPYFNVPFVRPPPAATGGGLIRMNIPPPPPPPQVLPPPAHHQPPVMADGIRVPMHLLNFPGFEFGGQRQMWSTNELGEIFRNLSISNYPDEINNNNNVFYNGGDEEVPADDRTIFLTFSKGYPITEDEVRFFFTRRFGNFIENLIMQEVGEDEQVLYARMVVTQESMGVIEAIVGGNKEKYAINGKHVWARKYVKKTQNSTRSPPRGGGGSSPPHGAPNPN